MGRLLKAQLRYMGMLNLTHINDFDEDRISQNA